LSGMQVIFRLPPKIGDDWEFSAPIGMDTAIGWCGSRIGSLVCYYSLRPFGT
jgi:hypothetical protein